MLCEQVKGHQKKMEKRPKGKLIWRSHRMETTSGEPCWSPTEQGHCCIVNQLCVFFGCSNNISDIKFQRSGNVNCLLVKTSVGILCLLPTVLLSHMKTCATGNTFFLKQLIVFMPELNEKDHRTVHHRWENQD